MRTLSSDIKAAVANLNQDGSWVRLYEVIVNAGAEFGDVTNEYLTDNTKTLTYSAKDYRPFIISHEDINDTSKPEQNSFFVDVANIDRAIAAYLEAGKIVGNRLKITWVFLKAQTQEVVYAYEDTFDIVAAGLTNAVARFEVGQSGIFSTQLPKNRYINSRCEWVYKSIGLCDYGRDEFEGVSRRQINSGLPNNAIAVHGWRAFNVANAALMDIDLTYSSELLIRVSKAADVRWNVSTRTGPFLYRIFPAADFVNFEIEINITGVGDEADETVGMLFTTDSDTSQDWLYACHRFTGGAERVQFQSLDNNSYSTIYNAARTDRYLKIKKTGSTFELFVKASEGASYGAAVGSASRADLNNVVLRAGVAVETYNTTRATDFDARVGYWRLLSGGKAACDRLLRSANGCDAHENSFRFGAEVGILSGPVSL